MTPTTTQALFPANIRLVLMEGGTELIGPRAAEHLMARLNGQAAFGLSALHRLLQDDYGFHGGQGMAHRLGRACFHHGLRSWGEDSPLSGGDFRFLPAPRRIYTVLTELAGFFGEQFDARVSIDESASAWFWRVERCPACLERLCAEPDCHLLAGVLQEALAWAGGGRLYPVREIACTAARQAACLFQLDKKPLD
jgi:predicted hydrocarbon binding protein